MNTKIIKIGDKIQCKCRYASKSISGTVVNIYAVIRVIDIRDDYGNIHFFDFSSIIYN